MNIAKVKDIMSQHVITVTSDQTIGQVAITLMEKRISGAPVVDSEGKICGIISEYDCIRDLFSNLITGYDDDLLEKFMSKDVITIHELESVATASEVFVVKKIQRLPVINNEGELCGIITRGQVARHLTSLMISSDNHRI